MSTQSPTTTPVANEITRLQFERSVGDFKRIAKEEIEVEFHDSAFWVFGSELAALRLAMQYKNASTASNGYSANLGSFYFKLDVPNATGEMSTN